MDNRGDPADAAHHIAGIDVMRQLSCAGIAVVWQAHQSRYDELRADYYTETILSANLEAERDEARAEVNDHAELLDRAAERHLASLARIAELETELERGAHELRRYVEGNGFEWQEDETAVWNATTAIGWLGGALAAIHKRGPEWRCETCLSFNALTYDCNSEWAPLKCVMNNFDGWEAKDELL